MDKILNTRLKIKIDTEQNWNNNPTFIPLEGELIAYKYDNGIQLKIGDGIKTISQLGFIPGIHYTPSVDSDGVLSWSNNGGLNNPNSINIRGPVGKTPNFSIGTVETSSAQASATITGSAESPVLNLSIPKGDTGTVSQEDMTALENIAQGKSKCTVLDNQTALREHFSSNIENINTLYKKGDIFLLRQVQVPDYWWEPRETETLLQPYYNIEENSNEIEIKDSNGNQIGFLRLLEMSKIDLSDYALKSDLPKNTNIQNEGFTHGETWYFPLGHMVIDNSGNYGNFSFSGRFGGWTKDNSATYQIMLMNRGNYNGDSITSTVQSQGKIDEAQSIVDIVVSKNDDLSHTVYLKCSGYFLYNFNWETFQHSIIYDGTYSTSEPTNIIWKLSTAPKTILSSDGIFSASGGVDSLSIFNSSTNTYKKYKLRMTSNTSDAGLEGYITFIV